jgi:hypothetical protein
MGAAEDHSSGRRAFARVSHVCTLGEPPKALECVDKEVAIEALGNVAPPEMAARKRTGTVSLPLASML